MHIQVVGVTHALRKSKFLAVFLSRYVYHGATLCFTEVRAAILAFVSRLFSAHSRTFSRESGFFCETLFHRNLRETAR